MLRNGRSTGYCASPIASERFAAKPSSMTYRTAAELEQPVHAARVDDLLGELVVRRNTRKRRGCCARSGDGEVLLLREELRPMVSLGALERWRRTHVAHELSSTLPLETNGPVAQVRAVEFLHDLVCLGERVHLEVAVWKRATSRTVRSVSSQKQGGREGHTGGG